MRRRRRHLANEGGEIGCPQLFRQRPDRGSIDLFLTGWHQGVLDLPQDPRDLDGAVPQDAEIVPDELCRGVDLVGHASRQLSKRLQLLRGTELRLHPVAVELRPSRHREVVHHHEHGGDCMMRVGAHHGPEGHPYKATEVGVLGLHRHVSPIEGRIPSAAQRLRDVARITGTAGVEQVVEVQPRDFPWPAQPPGLQHGVAGNHATDEVDEGDELGKGVEDRFQLPFDGPRPIKKAR